MSLEEKETLFLDGGAVGPARGGRIADRDQLRTSRGALENVEAVPGEGREFKLFPSLNDYAVGNTPGTKSKKRGLPRNKRNSSDCISVGGNIDCISVGELKTRKRPRGSHWRRSRRTHRQDGPRHLVQERDGVVVLRTSVIGSDAVRTFGGALTLKERTLEVQLVAVMASDFARHHIFVELRRTRRWISKDHTSADPLYNPEPKPQIHQPNGRIVGTESFFSLTAKLKKRGRHTTLGIHPRHICHKEKKQMLRELEGHPGFPPEVKSEVDNAFSREHQNQNLCALRSRTMLR